MQPSKLDALLAGIPSSHSAHRFPWAASKPIPANHRMTLCCHILANPRPRPCSPPLLAFGPHPLGMNAPWGISSQLPLSSCRESGARFRSSPARHLHVPPCGKCCAERPVKVIPRPSWLPTACAKSQAECRCLRVCWVVQSPEIPARGCAPRSEVVVAVENACNASRHARKKQ